MAAKVVVQKHWSVWQLAEQFQTGQQFVIRGQEVHFLLLMRLLDADAIIMLYAHHQFALDFLSPHPYSYLSRCWQDESTLTAISL